MMKRTLLLAFLVATPLRAQTAVDSIARLPGAAAERDTVPLLGAARIAALPAAQRAAWTRYIQQSDRLRQRDRALIDGELRALGRTEMTRAAYVRESFEVAPTMTAHWLRSDSGRAMTATLLSYQTPSGGWSKHVDMRAPRRAPGQSFFSESESWQYIATIDNNSTTSQLRYLARANAAIPDARLRDAFNRGVRYLLQAQFPSGCWPQVYPLQGGYHDAATYNDDSTVLVAELLREIARGEFAMVPRPVRAEAASAVAAATRCMVNSQVVTDGKPTVWGQQHDPISLEPTHARSYELTSLTAKESASIMRFLMSVPNPDARVVAAVHGAAAWFRANPIHGYTYSWAGGRAARPGAGPLWARMYELGTLRPIFSNRNGVKLYDYEQLNDRRAGYAWYTDEPVAVLREYDRWAARHPTPTRHAHR